MRVNDAIGGYFELELYQKREFHIGAVALNTARNCLEYILVTRQYKKVYIPFYTCEVVLEPFHKYGIEYEFYSINDKLEPVEFPLLKADEAFLFTNYFGLKQAAVQGVAERYGQQTIIDNAQAFYAPRIEGIDTFYSPRKFFGVPDGGYVYCDAEPLEDIPQDVSWERMQHLLRRIDEGAEKGYVDFKTNSEALINSPILRMSNLTHALLCSIDYDDAKRRRWDNYQCLDSALKKTNMLHLSCGPDDVPMVYPYLTTDVELRDRLISSRIYVATYWPNVLKWCDKKNIEYNLARNILPIPIDQRYDLCDMKKILDVLHSIRS